MSLDRCQGSGDLLAIQIAAEINHARRVRKMLQPRHAVVQPDDAQENAGVYIFPRGIAIPASFPCRLPDGSVRVLGEHARVLSDIKFTGSGADLREWRATQRLLVEGPKIGLGRIRQLIDDGLLVTGKLM